MSDPVTLSLIIGSAAGAGSLATNDKTLKNVLGGISLAGLATGGAGALGAFGGAGAAATTPSVLQAATPAPAGVAGAASRLAPTAASGLSLSDKLQLATLGGGTLGGVLAPEQPPRQEIFPPILPPRPIQPTPFEPSAVRLSQLLGEEERLRRRRTGLG